MKFDKKYFLPILISGIFYGLAFPPLNLYFLIYLSFVLLLDIVSNCVKLRQVIYRTYSVFLYAGIVGVSWIALSGMRDNADPFLIIGGTMILFIYPLFFIPPAVLFYYIRKNTSSGKLKYLSLIIFPFLWTGFEYLQTQGQVNFPWLFAGNSQTYNLSKIQYADYTGMFGVSFWVCTVSVLLYFLFINLKSKQWKPVSGKSILTVTVIVIIYFLPDFYNTLSKRPYPAEGKIKVGIVQPNINPWDKWSGKQNDLIGGYLDQIRQISSEHPDVKLILLPETALPYYFRERYFSDRYTLIKDLCDSLGLPFLIGTPDLEYYKDQSEAPDDAKFMKSSGLKYDTYNSAVLFEPGKDKDEFQKHQKIKLVVGSESMPYQELFPFSKQLVQWGVGISSWQIGRDTNNFKLKSGETFNTAICYESVYPEFFAKFVDNGAQFSVIITNDGWWGKFFGTYQHNMFAVFRAIENRRWIARCANTGISDFIDPEGNMYEKTEIDVKTNIVFDVGLRNEKTFYTMHGDLFAKICLAAGLIFFGMSFLVRRKN